MQLGHTAGIVSLKIQGSVLFFMNDCSWVTWWILWAWKYMNHSYSSWTTAAGSHGGYCEPEIHESFLFFMNDCSWVTQRILWAWKYRDLPYSSWTSAAGSHGRYCGPENTWIILILHERLQLGHTVDIVNLKYMNHSYSSWTTAAGSHSRYCEPENTGIFLILHEPVQLGHTADIVGLKIHESFLFFMNDCSWVTRWILWTWNTWIIFILHERLQLGHTADIVSLKIQGSSLFFMNQCSWVTRQIFWAWKYRDLPYSSWTSAVGSQGRYCGPENTGVFLILHELVQLGHMADTVGLKIQGSSLFFMNQCSWVTQQILWAWKYRDLPYSSWTSAAGSHGRYFGPENTGIFLILHEPVQLGHTADIVGLKIQGSSLFLMNQCSWVTWRILWAWKYRDLPYSSWTSAAGSHGGYCEPENTGIFLILHEPVQLGHKADIVGLKIQGSSLFFMNQCSWVTQQILWAWKYRDLPYSSWTSAVGSQGRYCGPENTGIFLILHEPVQLGHTADIVGLKIQGSSLFFMNQCSWVTRQILWAWKYRDLPYSSWTSAAGSHSRYCGPENTGIFLILHEPVQLGHTADIVGLKIQGSSLFFMNQCSWVTQQILWAWKYRDLPYSSWTSAAGSHGGYCGPKNTGYCLILHERLQLGHTQILWAWKYRDRNFINRLQNLTMNEPQHDKTNKMACAPSEDSDQLGQSTSLIRVFAVRMKKAWVLSYPLSAQRRLWTDWADAQADLSLRWVNMPFCWFCHEAAHKIWNGDPLELQRTYKVWKQQTWFDLFMRDTAKCNSPHVP